jgi:hypothetical protein
MTSFHTLVDHPTTIKILLALLELGQAYQFQLILATKAHRNTVFDALGVLVNLKLVKVVPPDRRVKNAGEFYGLTACGKEVAEHLRSVAALLEKHR